MKKQMRYDEEKIKKLYQKNLEIARKKLSSLSICKTKEIKLKELNGWIFQQTICYCLSKEFSSKGIHLKFKEEVPLFGRIKIDLLINYKIAVEVKVLGGFNKGYASKYKKYKSKAQKKGWKYFYLTLQENYPPYRKEAISIFGKNHSFFLDTPGEWRRFLKEIKKAL